MFECVVLSRWHASRVYGTFRIVVLLAGVDHFEGGIHSLLSDLPRREKGLPEAHSQG